jgi:signal transduction histidine kinase
MSRKFLSILLSLLLVAAVVLSAVLLVAGPNRVEHEAVEMFKSQQALVAEQGAMRISETFLDIQTRLDEAAERLRDDSFPAESESHTAVLERLSHPNDRDIGLVLLMSAETGGILAVGPGGEEERTAQLADLHFDLARQHLVERLNICTHCLAHPGSVSIVSAIGDGRALVANVSLEALLADDGEVLFEQHSPDAGENGAMIVGTAGLPHSDWKVLVETPYAVIAPEVRRSTRSLLYATVGLLVVLALALGLFGYRGYREQAARVERTRTLARADKLATVGMLSASIAHEVRNVISVVELNVELARRSPTDNATHLDRAARGLDRLTRLADNIKGYVGGTTADEVRAFGLSGAVQEATGLLTPKFNGQLLQLETRANPTINGSAGAITQVIVNLLLNAHDEVGEAPEPEIRVEVYQEGDFGVVEVVDNGPGIEPEVFDRIFEPFVSTKGEEAVGGTGLGLWLCSEIVSQHGGTIRAENTEGGARFIVRLPVAKQLEAGQAEEAAVDSASAPGEGGRRGPPDEVGRTS